MQIEKIKLAEYDLETGKFKEFLELSKCKIHFDDSNKYLGVAFEIGFLLGKNAIEIKDDFDKGNEDIFLKDEKDPLNRFGGFLDGRTYGEGRFVLIKDGEHEVAELESEEGKEVSLGYSWNSYGWTHLGNLHENPELWEKVKLALPF